MPSSAKKRGLPKEFVRPDPGPEGVLAGPGMQTQVTMRVAVEAREDGEKAHTVATATPILADKVGTHEGTMKEKQMQSVKALSSSNESSKSAKTNSDSSKPTITSNTATASSRPRRPLAPVQAQAPQPAPTTAAASQKPGVSAHKLGSLSATSTRPAFKPSTGQQGAIGAAGTGTRRSATLSKAGTAVGEGGAKDTKSLLAALQALKRPV